MSTPNPYMRGKTNRRGYLRDAPTDDQFERVTLGVHGVRAGDRYCVAVRCALVATNAPILKRLVVDAIADGATDVDLDLSSCDRADRHGLQVLVQLANLAHRRLDPPVRLMITRIHDDLCSQLKIMRIDGIIAIAPAFPSTPTSPEAHF